jgi:hypothetical protein
MLPGAQENFPISSSAFWPKYGGKVICKASNSGLKDWEQVRHLRPPVHRRLVEQGQFSGRVNKGHTVTSPPSGRTGVDSFSGFLSYRYDLVRGKVKGFLNSMGMISYTLSILFLFALKLVI